MITTDIRIALIAAGPREIGGPRQMMKAAPIAKASGLRICIHFRRAGGFLFQTTQAVRPGGR
ncbi:hypothetical protein OEW28_09670 [Defluviimonas sp. WL0002]|uniref:Uncharacterized protein n=1 Tax=Albidovulum marisflavi TaxID=2984159 RepID=A0ABT2ZCT0_9RHOB|nr:hypothetical protein [Defluviimonas sp. WL0002]MCV2868896.1 hypothetical protein [Defluviimonas sp. WL0002]